MKRTGPVLKALVASAFLTTAPQALAQACFQFDGQPRRCENHDCVYDFRTHQCTRAGLTRAYWTCEARDIGFEEHWRGHEGSAWTRPRAERRAIIQCQRFHGSCYVVNCYVNR